ncbi:MAG: hypothetical protein AAGI52_05730 [Bacteroidota bacterium]
MIRHISSRREDRVSDAVGCFRVFGSVFVCTGLGAISIALFGLAGMEAESVLARLGVFAIGAVHLAGGLAVCFQRSVSSTATRAGIVRTERRFLRPATRREFAPSEIVRFGVRAVQDSEGDDQWHPFFRLASGERVDLTAQPSVSRDLAEEVAGAFAQRIGKRSLFVPSGAESARALTSRDLRRDPVVDDIAPDRAEPVGVR